MNEKKLKIIILSHGGAERFLELVSALENVEVAGVFVETVTERKRSLARKIRRSIRYDGFLSTAAKLKTAVFGSNGTGRDELAAVENSRNRLVKYAETMGIPVFQVEDYHSDEARQLMRDANADLGVLYGTNIVRESVFSIPRLGSINIHQGLAPMYRGGPPVFWELFNGEQEIGITVHFVAAAVDSGDIVLQTRLPLAYDHARYGLDYEDFLHNFRASLAGPSAQLLADAVQRIANGTEQRTKQDTTLGKRYRLPVKSEKDELLGILMKRFNAR